MIDAKYIAIGSPTLNSSIYPSVAGFLNYMSGLCPKNRVGFAFGSYGWGGQSIPKVEEILKQLNFDVIPSFSCQYIPFEDTLDKLKKNLADEILKRKGSK